MMSLASDVRSRLSAMPHFQSGTQTIDVTDNGRRFVAVLTACDQLACAFDRLAIETTGLADATVDDLKRISRSLTDRLTYLLEPISPIEVDAQRCVIQMRSTPPQQGDDGTRYYELLVCRGGELSLRRWQKTDIAGRQAIDAEVTREVFGRLADDFAAVAP